MTQAAIMTTTTRSLAAAAAGPIAIGAVLGLPFGLGRVAVQAAALPAIFAGVALVMAPALYIAASLVARPAPHARDVARSFLEGLRASGTMLIGLAAPTAFLLVTTRTQRGALVVGAAV